MNILRISNKVNTFSDGFRNEFEVLKTLGHTIIWAADFKGFKGDLHDIPVETFDLNLSKGLLPKKINDSCKRLGTLIGEKNIEGIYCSTPIGGTIGRLCGKRYKVKHVVYAAHGFLFFKGNRLLKNVIFRLHEKWLARYTNSIVTITNEDYLAAKTFKLKNHGKIYFVHGAGFSCKNNGAFSIENNFEIHASSPYYLISGGFLNKNKNNIVVLKALKLLKNKNVIYIVCGEGKELATMQKYVKRNKLEEQVIFAGFRKDFSNILYSSNCFIMPSFREGVPRSLLEAMSLGLPCIGSNTRGIRELIGTNGEGGFICNPRSPQDFANAISSIIERYDISMIQKRNREEALKYSNEIVRKDLEYVFSDAFGDLR